MSTPFLTLIENSGFLNGDLVDEDKVQRISVAEIVDFAKQATETTQFDMATVDEDSLVHFASQTLSGHPHPCSNVECRLARAGEAAQFATFYSDRVLIDNVFDDYAHDKPERHSDHPEKFRERFINDLKVYAYFRQFIEAGRIHPVSFPRFCRHTVSRFSFGKGKGEDVNRSYEELMRRFRSEIKITARLRNGKLYVRCSGPDSLMPHGGIMTTYQTVPEKWKKLLPTVRGGLCPVAS